MSTDLVQEIDVTLLAVDRMHGLVVVDFQHPEYGVLRHNKFEHCEYVTTKLAFPLNTINRRVRLLKPIIQNIVLEEKCNVDKTNSRDYLAFSYLLFSL